MLVVLVRESFIFVVVHEFGVKLAAAFVVQRKVGSDIVHPKKEEKRT